MRDTWRITSQKAIFEFSKLPAFRIAVPSILQFILNASLIILAVGADHYKSDNNN